MGIIDQIKAQQIANPKSGAVTSFSPGKTKLNDAKADAVIDMAKRLRDWPLLEEAVDAKLEEQREFVVWWRANVGVNHGAGRGKKNAVRGSFSVSDAEAETGITQQQVSKWNKRLGDKEKYRADLYGAAWRKAMSERGQTDLRGASGTGENEWYTPAEYVELAREVMGGIDLDPASSERAQVTVQATAFYTEEDDGLAQDWDGKVFLNPPYAQPAIGHFAEKMVTEWEAKRSTSAVVLTHNYTDTAWFQKLARAATAICFTRGRVKFVSPEGALAAPTQGQAFFYFGHNLDAFIAAFADVGFVVEVRG